MAPSPTDSDLPSANRNPSKECWVFKLGGSLLDLPDLAERLRVVVRQVSTKPLIVVGGGNAADLVREWGEVHALSASSAHWLAVQAMEFNRHLLKTLVPEAVTISHLDQATDVWEKGSIALLNSFDWLQRAETQSESLPHSWEVTSDSIAAWVALRWHAEGMILLKSRAAPHSHASLCESVDAWFPRLLPQLPALAWCNLRSDPIQVETVQ